MALTKEQKRDLIQLGEYFKKLEKVSIENNIDLDVYLSDYRDGKFYIFGTERISRSKRSEKRKKIFEQEGKSKNIDVTRNL